jgi:hypothetical protein
MRRRFSSGPLFWTSIALVSIGLPLMTGMEHYGLALTSLGIVVFGWSWIRWLREGKEMADDEKPTDLSKAIKQTIEQSKPRPGSVWGNLFSGGRVGKLIMRGDVAKNEFRDVDIGSVDMGDGDGSPEDKDK